MGNTAASRDRASIASQPALSIEIAAMGNRPFSSRSMWRRSARASVSTVPWSAPGAGVDLGEHRLQVVVLVTELIDVGAHLVIVPQLGEQPALLTLQMRLEHSYEVGQRPGQVRTRRGGTAQVAARVDDLLVLLVERGDLRQGPAPAVAAHQGGSLRRSAAPVAREPGIEVGIDG